MRWQLIISKLKALVQIAPENIVMLRAKTVRVVCDIIIKITKPMNKRITSPVIFGITLCLVAILLSCSGNTKGMQFTRIDDRTILLEGDTFYLQYHNSDYSMLIVSPWGKSDSTMVMRQETDSLYYQTLEAKDISQIYDTEILCLSMTLTFTI